MTYIPTPEDEILIAAVITALAHQAEPLPEIVVTQLQQLGQIPPAELNNKIQDFLDDLDYQPLRKSVIAIEKQLMLDNYQRGKGSPPLAATPEHSAAIFNSFTLVTAAADIRQAAIIELAKLTKPIP